VDPEVWNLLHDGVVIAVAREGDHARVTVSAPHLAVGFGGDAFDLVLGGTRRLAYRPYSDRWDEPWVEGPAIASAMPELAEAKLEQGELRVWCPLGVLAVDYDTLALEVRGRPVTTAALREAVAAYWAKWREKNDLSRAHPLVREALRSGWSAALMPRLREAWQAERTSELADAIEVLGHALDRVLDRAARPLVTLEEVEGWPADYRRAPTAALDVLVDAATATFDLLADEEPPRGSPLLGDWLARRTALSGRWWRAFADALATLRSEPPDPRIGRAMIRMLRSTSEHWFRVDQVGHVAGPFEAPDQRPSFADHALALMELHADAGTPARLEERAANVAIECDCNGAEMVARLRALAATLRERYPEDRTLPDTAKTALIHRPAPS
jgi:hypothetical protein